MRVISYASWNRCPQFSTQAYIRQAEEVAEILNETRAPPVKRIYRTIGTLNQTQLQPTDFMDLSERRCPYIQIRSIDSCPLRYGFHRANIIPFPPNTRGFLYYHNPQNLPETCAEVRFRLTPTNDPADFVNGTDLIGHNATPWSITPLNLSFSTYASIRSHLIRAGLMKKSFANSMIKLTKKDGISRSSPHEKYYLEQPFMYDLAERALTFRTLTANEARTMMLKDLFTDRRELETPYKGRILLRFERSLFPHHGTNKVVLRVLDILDPVELNNPMYDGHVPIPVVDQLLLKRRWSQVLVRSWDLEDNTNKVAYALKILPSIIDDADLPPQDASLETPPVGGVLRKSLPSLPSPHSLPLAQLLYN
ncbi:hypothetical protein DXG01_003011 [Tephrocybe rancida]|nr:hypothetical protein DXG01_003011 [Tephrocybe rancida]